MEKKNTIFRTSFKSRRECIFPSPYKEAAILTMDGVGEWATTSVAVGKENDIEILKEIHFPHSLGLLYSAFTYFTGFKVNSGEYKIMGLAPYGSPKYVNIIKKNLVDIKDDGSFSINLKYFDYCAGLKMTNKHFENLFQIKRRKPESEIEQSTMDLASSIQKVTEEIVIKIGRNIKNETNAKNLCLSGGVALNCVANGKLLKENIFKSIWIQPASGDAGGAIGAALSAYHLHLKRPRVNSKKIDGMNGSYLGPNYKDKEIEKILNNLNAVYNFYSEKTMIELVAKKLSGGYGCWLV